MPCHAPESDWLSRLRGGVREASARLPRICWTAFSLRCITRLCRNVPFSLRPTLVTAGLLAAIGSSLAQYPHELAYFNELAGGPENGHKHLLGSNIDWGQELLLLKEWMSENALHSDEIGLTSYVEHVSKLSAPRLLHQRVANYTAQTSEKLHLRFHAFEQPGCFKRF